MARNLVICCDGTGNQYGAKNSNVVKLYSALRRDSADQLTFYDPGVGTFSVNSPLNLVARGFLRLLGLAFGLGITENILDAYTFIMQNYRPGDRVYLFGFSRGAYTARAVAALIHKCGQLGKDNHNLLPYAMRIFKRELRKPIYDGFKETFARSVPIHFLGLWDTVTTVGWIWNPVHLQFTTFNPSVETVRHAVAIDERRAFYRQNLWSRDANTSQDVKQVWFAGVHSDVGGSYPEPESGLSKIALEWILVEAIQHGLLVDPDRARKAVYSAPAPDHRAELHNSLAWYWWPGELWPKIVSFRNDDGSFRRRPHLNLGRRRRIARHPVVHQSVVDRLHDRTDGYSPRNLPDSYSVESAVSLLDVLAELEARSAARSQVLPISGLEQKAEAS
jgi:uncharacterized protein (DUF2235 family)